MQGADWAGDSEAEDKVSYVKYISSGDKPKEMTSWFEPWVNFTHFLKGGWREHVAGLIFSGNKW